jgi:hypothetical protein
MSCWIIEGLISEYCSLYSQKLFENTKMLMNFVLYRHGYPMLNIPYEKRADYYRSLERSQIKKMIIYPCNGFSRDI